MSRGRKERTPAQLAVLAQAREKAKIAIAERAKINAFEKTVSPEPEPVAVSDEAPRESEPVAVSDEAPPEPEPLSVLEDPASESEDEEPPPAFPKVSIHPRRGVHQNKSRMTSPPGINLILPNSDHSARGGGEVESSPHPFDRSCGVYVQACIDTHGELQRYKSALPL